MGRPFPSVQTALPTMSESLRQLGEGDEILQKQWKRVVEASRANGTADKVVADWDLLERTFRETWYSNRARAFRAKVFGHDQQGLTEYLRSTLRRKGMWFPRTLPQTCASWGQLVPQPIDPVYIVDPEALTRAWQRTKRAGPSFQMTDEELTISGVCGLSRTTCGVGKSSFFPPSCSNWFLCRGQRSCS